MPRAWPGRPVNGRVRRERCKRHSIFVYGQPQDVQGWYVYICAYDAGAALEEVAVPLCRSASALSDAGRCVNCVGMAGK